MATTTLNLAAAADDIEVNRTGTDYPPSTNAASYPAATTEAIVVRRYDSSQVGSQYRVMNYLLRWDSSSIPDGDTVTGASLQIKTNVNGVANTNNIGLYADWFSWVGNNAVSDWYFTPLGNALSNQALSGLAANTTYTFPLLNASANVNKTGYTRLVMMLGAGAITGANRVHITNYEADPNFAPKLIIDHISDATPPSIPTGLTTTVSFL